MLRESVALLCQNGRQALTQQDYDLARRFYQAAIVLKEDDAEAHHGLATVHFLLNDLDGAVRHFTQVTRLDPHRAGAFINLGAIYNQLDRIDEAVQVLRRGIQLDPNRAEGYYNLALAHRRQGQTHLAVSSYQEALRVNPGMADAHYNLANLYAETERHGQAIAHYRKALEIRPRWDKAEDGLIRAEAAQAGIALPEPGAEAAAGPDEGRAEEPAEAPRALDPTRVVDPNEHGLLLKAMHQSTLDYDMDGRHFVEILRDQVDPTIKDLSACLLMSDSPISELEERIRKFEKAVRDLRKIQQSMQERMNKIQAAGDQLLQS